MRGPKPRASAEGAVTPEKLLEAYNERVKAIGAGFGKPEEQQAQIAALANDPILAPLFQQPAGRQIVRTGTKNGKKVVQYSDGTIEEQP